MITDAPGTELARSESSWLAPYTLYTILEVGSLRDSRVQWFTPNGKLEREIHNVDVSGNPGFVSRRDASGTTFTSVANPRWEIHLPIRNDSEEGPSGWMGWTADGRVFVLSSRTTESYDEWPRIPTRLDMFVEGKRKAIGPYPGAPHAIQLDASGAMAVHFVDGRLVVVDRNGRERFQTTVPTSPGSLLLACNDDGVLIRDMNDARPIEYYGVEGVRSSFRNPGGYPRLWVGRDRVLFDTNTDSMVLVDCAKGRVIWRSGDAEERAISGSRTYVVAGRYLVTAAIELERTSQSNWPVARLRALELETGQLVAIWSGDRTRGTQPRFFERDGKVLFLDGSRLSEIDPDDIRESRQGWISSQPPEPTPSLFEEGPPTSPLSWKPVGSRKTATFAPLQRIASADRHPISVDLVRFRDARPYSDKGQRDVWLARYDSVRVQIDSTRTLVMEHLSAAFDATTGNLVCAFTDPAPRWIRSKLKPVDFEARVRKSRQSKIAPAAYANLQSTPGEILGALLGMWDMDLSTVGQIVLRPRFVTAQLPARRFEGKLTPVIPPSNTWIVEVLGIKMDLEYGCASMVAEFRDDTREMIMTQPMP
jgi:hypothetical protein